MSPGPRDTAPPLSLHVHVPPACRHMYLHPYREGKAWNTKQSSPESWPTYLVSSRLIIQLVQGRADTVKSITTQFGHWWFIRYKQIYCHYTSNFYHIIGEKLFFLFSATTKFTFPPYKSCKISHFPHLYHIQIIQKQQKTAYFIFTKKITIFDIFHISFILADLSFSPFSSIYKKSPFFTFFRR